MRGLPHGELCRRANEETTSSDIVSFNEVKMWKEQRGLPLGQTR